MNYFHTDSFQTERVNWSKGTAQKQTQFFANVQRDASSRLRNKINKKNLDQFFLFVKQINHRL